jgi:hypothetical protein
VVGIVSVVMVLIVGEGDHGKSTNHETQNGLAGFHLGNTPR